MTLETENKALRLTLEHTLENLRAESEKPVVYGHRLTGIIKAIEDSLEVVDKKESNDT